MEEMIYTQERKISILHEGMYKFYHFVIVSNGVYPFACIEIPKNHRWFGMDYDDICLDCHGGLTYTGPLSRILNDDQGWYIVWNYGCTGDFKSYYLEDSKWSKQFQNDKKWTTQEIYEEVKAVIDQITETDKLEKYEVGEVVIYQNGNKFELGIIKSKCGGDDYFVNYHTGDTAARTNARNLHKVTNAYVFHVIRLDPDDNERRD